MNQIHPKDRTILEYIRPNMKDGPWIAGGAPLQWYNNEPVGLSDIDVFFKDQEQYDRYAKRMLPDAEKHGSEGILSKEVFVQDNSDVKVVFDTDNAVSIEYKNDWKIQLIKRRFYPNAKAVIDNFDITACQIITDGIDVEFGEQTLRDIKHKKLRIVNMRPSSIKRIVKYWAYGYQPVPGLMRDVINTPDIDKQFKALGEEYEF